MRTLAATVASLALCLILAACGGSSSSSSTPAATPSVTAIPTATPTPTPRIPGSICAGADLYGAFVSTNAATGTAYYQLGVTNVGAIDCILVNPPELHFKAASGADLGISYTDGVSCPTGGPYDPTACIDEDAVDLPPGQPTPAAGSPPGQLAVTVAVANIQLFAACPSPNVQAHFIALRFTGTTEDVRVELPQDIDLLTCVDQVRLQSYGPAS